jgi:hypothetical protein
VDRCKWHYKQQHNALSAALAACLWVALHLLLMQYCLDYFCGFTELHHNRNTAEELHKYVAHDHLNQVLQYVYKLPALSMSSLLQVLL